MQSDALEENPNSAPLRVAKAAASEPQGRARYAAALTRRLTLPQGGQHGGNAQWGAGLSGHPAVGRSLSVLGATVGTVPHCYGTDYEPPRLRRLTLVNWEALLP